MTALQALLLGILQGLTEFLPVSSSGHLILAEHFFGLHADPFSMQVFNVLLHAGTLAALLLSTWERWWEMLRSPLTGDWAHRRLLLLLVIATVPGAAAGFFFEDMIAAHFSSPRSVAFGFLMTAAILVVGERSEHVRRAEHLKFPHALAVGIAQAFALIPGLSRSGLTISAARSAGLSRQEAVDFSFLLAVPIIAGASLSAVAALGTDNLSLPPSSITLLGFLSSFCASVLAIRFLRQYALQGSLSLFSWYLIVASVSLFLNS